MPLPTRRHNSEPCVASLRLLGKLLRNRWAVCVGISGQFQWNPHLAEFDTKWGADYPSIVQSWRRNWERIIPFFDYPAEIRKVIYTTNAIESVNMSLRKVTKSRGSFPNDDALIKLYYLALRIISKKWTMPIQNWKAALNRFTILFDERMPQH